MYCIGLPLIRNSLMKFRSLSTMFDKDSTDEINEADEINMLSFHESVRKIDPWNVALLLVVLLFCLPLLVPRRLVKFAIDFCLLR